MTDAIRAKEVCLEHPDGSILVTECGEGFREIRVQATAPGVYVSDYKWRTRYGLELIKTLLKLKGPGWVCDEIRRDEDPVYVENDIHHDVFSFVDPVDLAGRDVLDFGCGCGASTMVMGRLAPGCRITGVEMVEEFLTVGRLRAEHYGLPAVTFLKSPSGTTLPDGIGPFDFIVFSAVFEHLLPEERTSLLPMIWSHLKPGGVLFLNQTPHRFFPVEGHTTGLPLINYLPDRAALALARRCSRRIEPDATWAKLLRKGIRGGTPGGITALLREPGAEPELLPPSRNGINSYLDLWYRSAAIRHGGPGLKLRRTMLATVRALTGHTVVPNLSMAIRKPER